MWLFLIGGYISGLLGSIHCVGMCGPITLAIPRSENPIKHLLNVMLYHTGRVITYILLGLLFGSIGHVIQVFVIQRYFSIGMGVLLLLIILIPFISKKANPTGGLYIKFNSFIQSTMSRLFKSKHPVRIFGLGLTNGLLPCAMSFTAIIASMGMGSLNYSMLFMLSFGLGTLPLLLIFNLFISRIKLKNQKIRKILIPILGISLAILFILRGMDLNIKYISPTLEYKNGTIIECEHEIL
jgi:sulfite exporter TauE/SafE